MFFFSEKYVHLNDCRNEPMTSTSDTRPSGLWVSVPTVCRSVVQEEFLLKTFAVEEEHVLTQERIMGQKGNLIALAGICEFHYSYFKRLWFNGSLNTGTSAHFNRFFEMSSTSRATASNKTMQNIVSATVELSLDKTEWKFVALPGNQLPPDKLQAFNWSKNNLAKMHKSQGLGWAFTSLSCYSLLVKTIRGVYNGGINFIEKTLP